MIFLRTSIENAVSTVHSLQTSRNSMKEVILLTGASGWLAQFVYRKLEELGVCSHVDKSLDNSLRSQRSLSEKLRATKSR